jgi:hypothetical protein
MQEAGWWICRIHESFLPYVLYSSSVTGSNQKVAPLFAVVMAIQTNSSSLLAPCQCGTFGGHLITSPFFIILLGCLSPGSNLFRR